jgi:phosphoribosyl-ATP pyrophosphohydrolase
MTPPDEKSAELTADVIARLFATIESRRGADPDESYVAGLLQKGTPSIARKVGEEAVETVVAALSDGRESLISESADLLFHLMVLWADAGLRPADIFQELARREGTSGIDEKQHRKG